MTQEQMTSEDACESESEFTKDALCLDVQIKAVVVGVMAFAKNTQRRSAENQQRNRKLRVRWNGR